MRFTVTVNGKQHEVTPSPGDLVRFEREYDKPVSVLDDESQLRTEYVYYIVYSALKRKGQFEGDFDTFLDALGEIQEDEAPLEGQA